MGKFKSGFIQDNPAFIGQMRAGHQARNRLALIKAQFRTDQDRHILDLGGWAQRLHPDQHPLEQVRNPGIQRRISDIRRFDNASTRKSTGSQIPPRNVNWSASGKWVHTAKIGFKKYFLGKLRRGKSETFYEKAALEMMGIGKLKATHKS